MTEPGARLKGESRQAFEAFRMYRDQGNTRSSRRVAQELAKSETLIKRWSSRWQWVYRVEQFEAEQDRQFSADMREERMRMARQHARIAESMLSKAVDRLMELDGSKLSVRDMVLIVDVAAKVQRAAVGDPHPTRHELTGPGGGGIPIDMSLGDDELGLMAELRVISGVLSERLGVDEDGDDAEVLQLANGEGNG